MHVPDRVYGIETEYGCILQRGDGTFIPPDGHLLDFLKNHLWRNENKLLGLVMGGCRLWHINGSLTYIDTGNHPEHATPEARSIRQAVVYYQAGDRLITRAFSSSRDDECTLLLFKNNLSNNPHDVTHTFGCHENYLIYSYDQILANQSSAFVPFLVSRQIFDGAGCWDRDGSFFISQRALFMGKNKRHAPFPVALKDQRSGFVSGRLHLTTGDSNMLEFAAFLKLGTTSLVLSLIESGWTSKMNCTSPMIDFYNISRSCPRDRVIYVAKMGWISALDVQEHYIEAVRHGLTCATFDSEETEHESTVIVAAWEAALHALSRNDIAWMRGRFDWVTKQWFVNHQNVGKKKSEAGNRVQSDFDILYHLIGEGSLQERMNAHWQDRRIVTDDEIVRAIECAPVRTRACIRAEFVRQMMGLDISDLCIEWEYLAVNERGRFIDFVNLFNPLTDRDSDVQSFTRKIMECHDFLK